jgi:hypothetical protein
VELYSNPDMYLQNGVYLWTGESFTFTLKPEHLEELHSSLYVKSKYAVPRFRRLVAEETGTSI